MPVSTEKPHDGACILYDVPNYSRDTVVVLANTTIKPNSPVGRVTLGAATAAAAAGNTGNGTCGSVTVGAGALPGVYQVLFIEPVTNLGTFLLEDPNGKIVGRGFVGTAFSGSGLGFTIADGATDFVAGDRFTITVAAGSGKYIALDPTATNGAAVCAGIAYAGVKTATSVDGAGVVIRRHAKLNKDEIDWLSLDAGQITTAIADLAALGVIVEASI